MNSYGARRLMLDPGRTALALRALHTRDGHYPFLYRFLHRRVGRLGRGSATLGRVRLPADLHARPYLAVVRRGDSEVFRRLVAQFQHHPEVTVIWDRRQGDRRAAPADVALERRRADRRVTPAADWTAARFILAPRATP
jgi:hypothetical protein